MSVLVSLVSQLFNSLITLTSYLFAGVCMFLILTLIVN